MNAVDYIHSLRSFGKKAGLDNITRLLARLGNPHKGMNFVHIAGTNGKGSVSSMINSIFVERYEKVGLFTSPFLECFNERICVNNLPIADDDLERLTQRVKVEIEYLAEEGILCTVFDTICAIAFLYFREKQCDIVVLEVGLGGRFDATNIIESPLCSVICAIGLDHTQYLGDTVSEVAFEKCGIIKPNCPVVSYPLQTKDAYRVIEDTCISRNSELTVPDINELTVSESNIKGNSFIYNGTEYNVPLVGIYQVYNALCAIEAATALGVDIQSIQSGLSRVKWKCRFEVFDIDDKIVVLDGAHNPHGLAAFFDSASGFFADKNLHIVFGMVNDKDIANSCSALPDSCRYITVTSVPSERGDNPYGVYECVKQSRPGTEVRYIEDNTEALHYALQSNTDVICVVGSLYMVGSIRKLVETLSQSDKTI